MNTTFGVEVPPTTDTTFLNVISVSVNSTVMLSVITGAVTVIDFEFAFGLAYRSIIPPASVREPIVAEVRFAADAFTEAKVELATFRVVMDAWVRFAAEAFKTPNVPLLTLSTVTFATDTLRVDNTAVPNAMFALDVFKTPNVPLLTFATVAVILESTAIPAVMFANEVFIVVRVALEIFAVDAFKVTTFKVVRLATLAFSVTIVAPVIFAVDAFSVVIFAVLMIAVLPTLTPTPGFVNVHAALDETCGPSVKLLAIAIIAATAVINCPKVFDEVIWLIDI